MIKRNSYKNYLILMLVLVLLSGCKMAQFVSVGVQISNSKNIKASKINNGDIEDQISKAKSVSANSDMSTIDEMDTVTFGSYPQSSKSANKLEPIEWIVLERDYKNNRALLLSKYILDNVSFNSEHKECQWKDSELRQWMNETFYDNAFSEDEKNQIVEDTHISDSFYDDENVDTVTDKVFVLSDIEVKKYFRRYDMTEENKKLATRGTNYAKNVKNNGINLWVRGNTGENTFGVTDDGLFYNKIVKRYADEALKFEWCIGNSFYWLRSNGLNLSYVSRVNSNGALINQSNFSVSNCQGGIRPAVWVKYNKQKNNNNEKEIEDFESIEFGKYKQTRDSVENEWRKEPIEWIILEKDSENKRALIISKYILDVRSNVYKSGEKNTTWKNNNIREWLNDKFYDEAFTEEEKNKIIEVQIVNEDNDDYMTFGGRDTTDKLFLLSISEARKYFSNGDNLDNRNQLVKAGAAKGTKYAVYEKRLGKISKSKKDEYEDWMLENSIYYLRSPAGTQGSIARVGPNAIISTSGYVGNGISRCGVRPAMWIEY